MKMSFDPTPNVTSLPKMGCLYVRVLQKVACAKGGSTGDTVTKKDLAPLRGVSDGVYRFLYSIASHNPLNTCLNLDTIAKQRNGGAIEHRGSLGCSPEHVVDGKVMPPRKDSARLPLLLQLLQQGRDDVSTQLTHADLARLYRLALDMDAQFFMKAPTASTAYICWAAISAGRSAHALLAQAFKELIPRPPPY